MRGRLREERAAGLRVANAVLVSVGRSVPRNHLPIRSPNCGGGAARGQVAQRCAQVGRVGRVAVDHVGSQDADVVGHVVVLGVGDECLEIGEVGGAQRAFDIDRIEDLQHVVAGDRSAGVETGNERAQRLVLVSRSRRRGRRG